MTELVNACVQRELELLNKDDSSMGSCLCGADQLALGHAG